MSFYLSCELIAWFKIIHELMKLGSIALCFSSFLLCPIPLFFCHLSLGTLVSLYLLFMRGRLTSLSRFGWLSRLSRFSLSFRRLILSTFWFEVVKSLDIAVFLVIPIHIIIEVPIRVRKQLELFLIGSYLFPRELLVLVLFLLLLSDLRTDEQNLRKRGKECECAKFECHFDLH